MTDKYIIGKKDAAKYCQISRQTIYREIASNRFPEPAKYTYIKGWPLPAYSNKDLDDYIKTKKRPNHRPKKIT